MLEKFVERKKRLFTAYEKLKEYKLVPIKNYTLDTIKEWKEQLEREEFIVSFCGQIKAGKSTLLNALIFRKPILPFRITPHTAKITVIKYGEKPSFTARFYNRLEWDKLIKELKKQKDEEGQSYYEKYLKSEVNRRIEEFGIYPETVLGRVEEGIDIKDLNEFVGADGKYTPFVKDVVIYYPNPILKDLTIVDTPGTNDPNPFRSRETLEWISRSNAIVYVVYGGQAFTEQDIQFINDYLLTVPSNLMVFAVNKIDTVESLQELKEWVEEVKKDERLKVRKIMADSESVVFVSALGGLIGRMLKDCEKEGIEAYDCIPEELKEKAENLYSRDFTEEKNHGLSELEKVIEDKLIKAKGSKVLCSHKRNIEGVIEENIIELKLQKDLKEKNLKALNSSIEEIDKRIEKIKSALQELNVFSENFRKECYNVGHGIVLKFEERIREKQRKLVEKFAIEVDKSCSEIDYDAIPDEVSFIMKNCLNELLEAKEILEKFLKEAEASIKELYALVFTKEFIPASLKQIFPINTIMLNVMAELNREKEKLSGRYYNDITRFKDELKHFFLCRIFLGKGNRSALLSKVKNLGAEELEKVVKNFVESFGAKLSREVDGMLAPILEAASKQLREEKRNLEDLRRNLEDKKNRREKLNREIKELEEKIRKVEKIKKELMSDLHLKCIEETKSGG